LVEVGVVFFFEGEDGIRDWSVTGVQTCALPIFRKDDPLPITCGLPGALPQPACGLYSPQGVDPILFTPTSQQWSLTIERGIVREIGRASCRERGGDAGGRRCGEKRAREG